MVILMVNTCYQDHYQLPFLFHLQELQHFLFQVLPINLTLKKLPYYNGIEGLIKCHPRLTVSWKLLETLSQNVKLCLSGSVI